MDAMAHIPAQLDGRRARLRMSKVDLARRADVSLPTVQRLLSGREKRPSVKAVTAVAVALGVEVRLSDAPHVHEIYAAEAFRERRAKDKSRYLVGLVQGTMALESAAVEDAVLTQMERQTSRALLTGSSRRLWSD